MKLKIEYINEETNDKLTLKNKGTEVYYNSSEIHDNKDFEKLSGIVSKFKGNEKKVIEYFYKLAGELI